ncbi:metal ABC transporter ATP-binding protein [Hespellia stercorisuis]|uniref:Zinc transport system ATP-binding protein n=1 Tax=Hespellia stercorisuis DSM 15480 TaxID=1121950 RepID=A0A1M6JUT7_9FIRM|nr:metal ABC transporter ATP-binding protein [Hespellia stercorisuis]SHJ50467.1 zinc transport system ATP-binding protein [Hespellia stercorisuis DSM 15480]
MSLITCENAAFAYENKPVIENLNFTVDSGDYLCIVGENGSGKSTLIKGLLQLMSPAVGKIIMGDELRANEIGYLPQQTALQKDFPASVCEVVLSGCLNQSGLRPFYGREQKQSARKNMEQLGILDLKNECYRDLSGGQQQRVLLARALCATTKMLLLDEPVTGLDPVVTYELYQLIEKINRELKITVVMVSHDIESAVKYASHILHLQNEQLFYGTTAEYLNSDLGKKFMRGDCDD